MLLNIYSLQKSVVQKNAKSVSVQTPNGEITVLENHEPLITPLVKGNIRILETSGVEETIAGNGGFIEVRPHPNEGGEVNILID
jgi:F-type H+-transporting ATPase subunit epsilon